jgi:hypothetical protein
MTPAEQIKRSLFQISSPGDFNALALEIFHFQYEMNPVYREFTNLLNIDAATIRDFHQVPFIPVSLFKDHKIISGEENIYQKVFTSSGTTGIVPSAHFVRELKLYEESFAGSFRHFYGDPAHYRFLALLPGYLERQGSSLVYMLDHFVHLTEHNGSGFFLHDLNSLRDKLQNPPPGPIRTLLFGASYALLDFSEQFPMDLEGVIVMETGGMKGRKKEMVREELHVTLCRRFNVNAIHSEYGMTELLSQAYSPGNGKFRTPPWMKVIIRETNDPLQLLPPGKTGGINIIDLANIYSCSFIATQDLGRMDEDGSFEILGRFDDSDTRGCNLLVV